MRQRLANLLRRAANHLDQHVTPEPSIDPQFAALDQQLAEVRLRSYLSAALNRYRPERPMAQA